MTLLRDPSRRLLAALLVSALLHLLTGGGLPWPQAGSIVPPSQPIQAHLAPPPAPSAVVPPAQTRPRPAARLVRAPAPPAVPAVSASPPSEPVVAAHAEPIEAASVQPEPLPSEVAAQEPPDPSGAAPPEPAPRPIPTLPESFDIRYVVQGNEGGLVLGRLDHLWRRNGDAYSIVGVAQASGLFALFYPGLLSQTSDGRVSATGLRPENYWMQRGRRQFVARFDWAGGQAKLGGRHASLAIPDGTQDYLSVVYQLAFYPPPRAPMAVVDGRRLRHYGCEEVGVETLDLPLGRVETRHVRLTADNEAEKGLEIWLRAAPPHLPVKIRILGGRHGTGVLLAESIREPDPASAPSP